MGTWNTSIKGNDITLDIYSLFIEKYNEGIDPTEISKLVKNEFSDILKDFDEKHNALFGLALAQWETKCLENDLLKDIKIIVDSGSNLQFWGNDKKTLNKRDKELKKFLMQISTERSKAQKRKKTKFEYTEVIIAKSISPDNKKEFKIADEYVNGKYIHSQGTMKWYSGGGSGILSYNVPNEKISIKWQNQSLLKIFIENDTRFSKQETSFFYSGDKGEIEYIKT